MPPPTNLKPSVYKDERPAEYFDKFHERSRTKDPDAAYELVRGTLTPIAVGLYRTRAIGTENVPAKGPVLLAPNHFSQMDHFFAGVFIRRKIRFMAKSQIFGPKGLTWIFTHGGVFPVRRGYRDDEAFKTVYAIFENMQGAVLVYAEGGRSRTGGLGEPRPGIGKIALESGVPVVPVAIHATRSNRPWSKFTFPKVTVQFGEPISFPVVEEPTREQQMETSNVVFEHVARMYNGIRDRGWKAVRREVEAKRTKREAEAASSSG